MKQFFFATVCMILTFSAYGQSDNNVPEYPKFYLSVNAGWDFALGSSSTDLGYTGMMTEPGYNLVLPATKRGFSPGFDAAWFFSKNYGVGIKYGFYTSDYKKESSLDLIDEMSYTYESTILAFNEKTHLFGPAVYTRWPLGNSKWMILANAGVVVLHNNLLGINRKIITIKAGRNGIIPGGLDLIDDTIYEQYYETVSDQKGVTVGFTLSAAIRYEIAPFAGISVQTNGLYASLSEMRYYNIINEQYENRDLSRKISRIGLSAAIDFCF